QAEVSTPAAILPPRTEEEGLGKALLQGVQVARGNRPHTPPQAGLGPGLLALREGCEQGRAPAGRLRAGPRSLRAGPLPPPPPPPGRPVGQAQAYPPPRPDLDSLWGRGGAAASANRRAAPASRGAVVTRGAASISRRSGGAARQSGAGRRGGRREPPASLSADCPARPPGSARTETRSPASSAPTAMSGCRVFIGRLNPAAREKDVERFFKGYGRIRDIDLKRGFGFVEFEDPRDADDAVYELDGKELCSERVTIEHARARSRGRGRGRYSDRFSSRRPRSDRRNAPPVRTENRLIVENLSSRVSWQPICVVGLMTRSACGLS
uniref:Serine and arginine rich splicing factor 5 n=1 Tax=Accipiter nisus TaxID=211598 RepID=A0A8B9MDC9_9AVES